MLAYPVRLTKDDNGTLLVTCPDLPEVTSFGESVNDALAHGLEAVEEAIAARIAHREPIPDASRGRMKVVLPAQIEAKVRLYIRMRAAGVSKNELARRLKWHRPQVDRLLNLRHGTRMDAVEAAFEALGARMSVDVVEGNPR